MTCATRTLMVQSELPVMKYFPVVDTQHAHTEDLWSYNVVRTSNRWLTVLASRQSHTWKINTATLRSVFLGFWHAHLLSRYIVQVRKKQN